MKKKSQLSYTIEKQYNQEFELYSSLEEVGDILEFHLAFGYDVIEESKKLIVACSVELKDENKKKLLKTEGGVYFKIISGWEQLYNEDRTAIVIPRLNMMNFAATSLGAIRGWINAKTGDLKTPITLPGVPIDEHIKKDVEIKLKRSDS